MQNLEIMHLLAKFISLLVHKEIRELGDATQSSNATLPG